MGRVRYDHSAGVIFESSKVGDILSINLIGSSINFSCHEAKQTSDASDGIWDGIVLCARLCVRFGLKISE